MRENLPDKNWFVGKAIPTRSNLVIKRVVGSGNDGHVFCALSTELQETLPAKLSLVRIWQACWKASHNGAQKSKRQTGFRARSWFVLLT